MSVHRVLLQPSLEQCPSWWQKLVYNIDDPEKLISYVSSYDIQVSYTEYPTCINYLQFKSEGHYNMFLLTLE